jgi:Superinfection immunity protein
MNEWMLIFPSPALVLVSQLSVGTLLGYGLGILLYFLPAILGRRRSDARSLLLFNLLLGWTFILWIAALVWALQADLYGWQRSTALPRALGLSQEAVTASYSGVRVEQTFFVAHPDYQTPRPLVHKVPTILVTDKCIIFLDEKNGPLLKNVVFKPKLETVYEYEDRQPWKQSPKPLRPREKWREGVRPIHQPLGSFWVLDRSLNEDLDREFKQNPTGYSKMIRAWWVRGCREWTLVSGQVDIHAGRDLKEWVVEIPRLERVHTYSMWGPGREVPVSSFEGSARLFVKTRAEAEALKEKINRVVQDDLGAPVSQEYVDSLPVKPMSGTYKVYYYVFWTSLGGATLLAVLWGAGAPFGVILLGSLGGCLAVACFLRSK